jgi:hypothetical protein
MTSDHENAIRELARLHLDIGNLRDGPLKVKLDSDFRDRWRELDALVGPSFRERFRKQLLELSSVSTPQTLWQRLRAMFLLR